jgi:hypothetical protein
MKMKKSFQLKACCLARIGASAGCVFSTRFVFWMLVVMALNLFTNMSLAQSPVPSNKPSGFPSWWFERDVIKRNDVNKSNPVWPGDYPVGDDFSVINQGQLKYLAKQAWQELEAELHGGGAGASLDSLITGWATPVPGTDNYASVNQGQLKALTKPFYDRLIEVGYSKVYPWTSATTDDDNFAAANIGQAKKLFSFNLRADTDTDGLPDWWEQLIINADPNDAIAGLADVLPGDNFDHDDFTNEEEAEAGTSPVLPNGADSDVDGLVDTTEPIRGTKVGTKDHPAVQLQFNLTN